MKSILPSAITRRETFTPSKFRGCLPIVPLWPALVVLLSGPVLAAPPPAPEVSAASRTAALSQSGQIVAPKQQFARTINIDMASKAFSVTSIKVRAGESVRFVLRNTSSSPHEFTVGTPDMQRFRRRFMKRVTEGSVIKSTLEKINPSERQQLESWNAVVVLPGETRDLLWTFDKTQNIEFGCNFHGHYEAGMKGQFHSTPAVEKKADFNTANRLDFPGVGRASEVKETGSQQTPSRVSRRAVQKANQPAKQKARKPILLTVRDHQRMAKMRRLWLASRTLSAQSKRRDPVVLTNFNSDRNVGRYHDKRGFVVARKDIRNQNAGAAESVAAALSSAVTAVFSFSDAVDDEGASDPVGSTRIRRAGFGGNNGEGGRGGNGNGDGGANGGDGGNGGGNGGNGGGNGGNGDGGNGGGDGGEGGGDGGEGGGDGGEGGGDGGEGGGDGGEGGGDGGEGGGDGGDGGEGGGDGGEGGGDD